MASLSEPLGNASEHDEYVTVGGADPEACSGVFVEDNGSHIPQSEAEQVFHLDYSSAVTGTGYDVSIVQPVADARS
ncbi:MAG: ATP-binding protein [Halolamina sp.]|uniref:ATP-binding protein n=1 Tax=Halolamina sp. TaxID=1940283 RepID=UPI002FC293AD